MALHNIARATIAGGGSGPLTLSITVPSFISFEDAGVSDGETVSYAIEDGDYQGGMFVPTQREVGHGTYSGGVLTRTTVLASTNGGDPIIASGNAQVFIGMVAEDLPTTVFAQQILSASDSPYEALVGDRELFIDSTSVFEVDVGSAAAFFEAGDVTPLVVKDTGGNADAHTITINFTDDTCDGASSLTITTRYGGFRLRPLSTGGWTIV